MDGTLTTTPQTALALLEEFRELDERVRVNHNAAKVFYEALREIHDRRLYESDGFDSWVQYCEARNLSRRHADRLVKGDRVREKIVQHIAEMDPGVPVDLELPHAEKHLRVLGTVPEDKLVEVVSEAQKRAQEKGRPATTKDYRQTRDDVLERARDPMRPVKVARKDAAMPEDYNDEEGYPVPEALWPVWRDIPAFLEVVDDIRSCGLLEHSRRLVALGQKHKAPIVIRIGNEIERLHKQAVELALSAKPARVHGDDWLTRSELEI